MADGCNATAGGAHVIPACTKAEFVVLDASAGAADAVFTTHRRVAGRTRGGLKTPQRLRVPQGLDRRALSAL